MDEQLFLYLAAVPLLGVAAQWLAWRMRLPSILLLLAFGIALGWFINPDVLLAKVAGAPDQNAATVGAKLLFPLVSLSVAVILFEGGLTLRLRELNESGATVLRLVTIGALVSWVLTALAATYVLRLDARLATLLGAILVVTGPTVVAPLLRSIRPRRKIGSVVKWEGIVIDPIGAVLAVLVFEHLSGHNASLLQACIGLLQTVAVGVLLGCSAGWFLTQVVRRYWAPDYLHGVLFLSLALGSYALSNWLQHEAGLVTVTVLGVYLANQKSVPIHHVVEFKEHLGVLLISCLFIVLGSRLNPADLWMFGWQGLAFLLLLILVVRPASIFLATIGGKTTLAERAFLAFLAPRGIVAAAVASVFALRLDASHELNLPAGQAGSLAPLTFLVIVGTVAFYGLLAAPLARWLKLADPNPQGLLIAGSQRWVRDLALAVREAGFQVRLVDTNFAHVSAARVAGIPAECVNILSEQAREGTDLSGIGRLLALTPNNEVNTLAAREFSHEFGRQNVYQLAPPEMSKRASMAEHLQGRILFGGAKHHDQFVQLSSRGWRPKKTKLTEEFRFEDFRDMYGEEAVVMFLINGNNDLQIVAADTPPEPQPGQSVIALVPPEPAAAS